MKKQQGLLFALHENAVTVLLGYVLGKVENGYRIHPDWELHINFNKKHQSLKLNEEDFVDGRLSENLLRKVSEIDPNWMVPGGKPVFMDARTRKILPLGWSNDAAFESIEDQASSIQKMLDAELSNRKDHQLTLSSVMRQAFVRRGV